MRPENCSSHPAALMTGSSNGLINARYCRYSVMSSWWWVKYHPKYVEQLTDLNKLYTVASCWIIIATYYGLSHEYYAYPLIRCDCGWCVSWCYQLRPFLCVTLSVPHTFNSEREQWQVEITFGILLGNGRNGRWVRICYCHVFWQINPCTANGNPCANGATCVALQQGRFKCECLPGWEGQHCELNTGKKSSYLFA